MQHCIHDSDVESDYINDDDFECDESAELDEKDEELYYGEKVSVFVEYYMKLKETKTSELDEDEKCYIFLLLSRMIYLMEEMEEIDAGVYDVLKREIIYVVFKTMNTEVAQDYFRTHHLFAQYCVDLAKETLEYIEEDFEDDELWKNTTNAVEEFLYEMK